MSDLIAGRTCPLDYRYRPEDMAAAPEAFSCEVLYVVGGLYGNPFALKAVEALAAKEPGARVVFNGDFHWFDADKVWFDWIQEGVEAFDALAGNVEKELCRATADAGCGCAYPETVDQALVERSNRIHQRLKDQLPDDSKLLATLQALPLFMKVRVGERLVALVHGDATSLAGWGFDRNGIDEPDRKADIQGWLQAAEVDAFASSHTCQPVCRRYPEGVVINNGAAGMPNFNDGLYGVVTRIANRSGLLEPLYQTDYQGLYYQALPLYFDAPAWQEWFLSYWPEGSDAWLSYWQRISQGTALKVSA
ncbi:MAG: hypothetical protein IBX50_12205 [Marinospirillum sp.]|uniref:metallophosphoesterase family protein n=1 Tax=Marinospirillum sp. TaxID=2183934 RepID=UPI0019F3AFE7|nr:hypothetical protein [Marinospirillum sp.]MBE0507459.1 hypothetical protein [Marinospirillum sp.]